MKRDKSQALFETASRLIPGGVNSPVRAFKSVGGEPLFIEKAKGSTVTDVDGNVFIDYVLSWGPMVVGHANPAVIKAVQKTAESGTSFGAPCALEVALAERVQAAYPTMERMRFVSSGTEATMSAIRLARGFTGRHKIIKFEGCYHGHADSLLVKAGSGATTLGIPDSLGVPPDVARDTITVPFNDLPALRKILENEGNNIACLILEPVPGNMGTIIPKDGFLPGLKELCKPFGVLLIFDEVLCGFRAAPGGAQARYGVRPDLTCLGKVIGGGLPVGAFGGRQDIMECIAPLGPVYQAGTLSGNPLAMVAGIETLKLLQAPGAYEKLESLAEALEAAIRDAAKRANVTIQLNRIASQMTFFFNEHPVENYSDALKCDTERFGRFHQALLAQGVYFPPSQFEAFFVSTAHTPEDIEKTREALYQAFKQV